jgi:hypothetical protein
MKKIVLKFYQSRQNSAPIAFVNGDDNPLHQVNPSVYKPHKLVIVGKELHPLINLAYNDGISDKYYCELTEMATGKGYIVTSLELLPEATAQVRYYLSKTWSKIDVYLNYKYFTEKYTINFFDQNPENVGKRYKYLMNIFSTIKVVDKEVFLNKFKNEFLRMMKENKHWKILKGTSKESYQKDGKE